VFFFKFIPFPFDNPASLQNAFFEATGAPSLKSKSFFTSHLVQRLES
jgi:hypothetical protein